jgi:2-hydroxymuconate-semialdehyde hydrolase
MGSIGVPFQITPELNALWGFYDEPSPERMAEVIGWFVYDPETVGGDIEAIARDRYGGATRPEISRSFASMFSGPDRQRHVDALILPDEAIERVEKPTLLVHGRDDVIIPLETSLYLLKRLQRPQMHVFGRCRHWIMIEHKDPFNRVLEEFLAAKI